MAGTVVLRGDRPRRQSFSLGLLAPSRAWAVGESITDVRILGNSRTAEDTVRSIAGVKIGDTLELDTLDRTRERLHTAGLFADVNVWWEQNGDGVRVNIAVKDKFPWAPVPTASWSSNNRSIGLVFVDGNLFGRGKQLVVGGRLADVDSGAVLAYRDPALFGGWGYWQLAGQRAEAGHSRVRRTTTRRRVAAARDAPDVVRFRDGVRHRLVAPTQDPGLVGPCRRSTWRASDVPETDTTPADATAPRRRRAPRWASARRHSASTSARASSRS